MTVPAGYRHGMRVRMGGVDGPLGVLLHCESRRTGGHYWRVRLQRSGDWVWPNEAGGIVVDGAGDSLGVCRSCGLRFVTPAGSGELICARCDFESFGRRDQSGEPPPVKSRNVYRRWIRNRGR